VAHPEIVPGFGQKLTLQGENKEPSFAPDGESFVFISQARKNHSHPQLYLFDLKNFKEKRLSFQNGECLNPIFDRSGENIFFASSTDEIKERPVSLYPEMGRFHFPLSEIYRLHIKSERIDRLTYVPGFQGFHAWLNPQSHQLLANSEKTPGKLQVEIIDTMKGRINQPKFPFPNNCKNPLVSAQGSRLCIGSTNQTDLDNAIFFQKGTQNFLPILLPQIKYQDMKWFNYEKSQLLFVWSARTESGISVLDLVENCKFDLLKTAGLLSSPSVSTDLKKILYSFKYEGGSQQIYLMEVPDSLPACEKLK
jgi:Tol biopolymer transport system component